MFYVYLSAIALGFLGLDQLTKTLAVHFLPYAVTVPVLGEFARFYLVFNRNGVFSLSFGPAFIYYILPLIGIALVLIIARRVRDRFSLVTYSLILGGALGNLFDRIVRGKVVDFIDLGTAGWRWATFNGADSFIFVGVVMLIARELFRPPRK